MDPDIRQLIGHIHAAPCKAAFAFAGGGATAASWLLAVPGGSRTVLEVAVPYSEKALVEYLRREPAALLGSRHTGQPGWCVPESGRPIWGRESRSSASAARPICLRIGPSAEHDHRIHVAAATESGTFVLSLTLAKEQREREGEEAVASRLALNALAEAFGLPARVALPLLPGEAVQREEHPDGLLAQFLKGEPAALRVEADGRMLPGRTYVERSSFRSGSPTNGMNSVLQPSGTVILPGSFNPLHEGHCGMAAVAARLLGRPVAFELSVANVEKPALTEAEVRRRMAHFAWLAPLWLTHAPTFLEKSRLFPGAVFVVGIDTAVRIVDPRFYGDSVAKTWRTAGGDLQPAVDGLPRCRAADGRSLCRAVAGGDPGGVSRSVHGHTVRAVSCGCIRDRVAGERHGVSPPVKRSSPAGLLRVVRPRLKTEMSTSPATAEAWKSP